MTECTRGKMTLVGRTLMVYGAAVVLLVGNAGGQEHGDGWILCTWGRPSVGRIDGRLVATPYLTDWLVQRVYLELEGTPGRCGTISSRDGSFGFRGLPEGRYRLEVADLYITPTGPIPILIRTDTVVSLDIPLFGPNALSECLDNPRCADILARPTALESLVDEAMQAYLFGYRVSIALAVGWQGGADWVLCIDDTDAVLDALREVYPFMAPRSECALEPDTPEVRSRRRRLLRHVPSDRPALSLFRGVIESDSDGKGRLRTRIVGPERQGAGYTCPLDRVGGRWVVDACYVTSVM